MDLLSKETFTCCKCKKNFKAEEGTWLTIAEEEPKFMNVLSGSKNSPPAVFAFDFKPPEVITSDDFTCYNCLPDEVEEIPFSEQRSTICF